MSTPRTVTMDQIKAEIASEHCFTAQDGVVGASSRTGAAVMDGTSNPLNLLTFCVLVMRNGFTVTGQSACADPAIFNAQKGRELAYEDAIRQCWKLLGFRLRDQIHAEPPKAKRYTREHIKNWWAHIDPIMGDTNLHAVMMDDSRVTARISVYPRTPTYSAEEMAVEAILAKANGEA